MKRFPAFLFALSLLTASVTAQAAEWTIDKVHSHVGFSVKHMMITTVHGEFTSYDAKVSFDPAEPTTLSVDATVDVNSIDTRVADRDKHLKSADFFDAANFPAMTFKTKKTVKVGEGKFKVTGDLTIRGTTHEVTFNVDGFSPVIKDPWGNNRVGATATATINRQDYGLKWNAALETGGVVVDNNVNIEIEVELTQNK
jgi:polyisoprenoid-binding protein YceI